MKHAYSYLLLIFLFIHTKTYSNNIWPAIEKKYRNTIVQVFVESAEFNWTQPYITPEQSQVSGSGFIINKEGYFITNAHVVDTAKNTWIQIPDLGRKNIETEIIGICPDVDVALLKIKEFELSSIKKSLGEIPVINLGDSDLISRTDEILVFGYPLGQYYLKTTVGVISGLEHIDSQMHFQIDAAINCGNSGGPVVNKDGKVIGIATAAIPSAENIGYILPINDLKIILYDLYKTKFFRKQKLGILYNSTNAAQMKKLNGHIVEGIYINTVLKDSIAEQTGIKEGDVLTQIEEYNIDNFGEINVPWSSDKIQISDLISRFKVNEIINLTIYRRGKKLKLKVSWKNMPLYPIRKIYPEYEKVDYEMLGGIVIMNLSTDLIKKLSDNNEYLVKYKEPVNTISPRLIISHIFPGSKIAQQNVFFKGDIIKKINEIEVNDLNSYRKALKKSIKNLNLMIETEDRKVCVFSFKQILDDELRLSKSYEYTITPTAKNILKQYQKKITK